MTTAETPQQISTTHIEALLMSLSISPHFKGFRCLVLAIAYALEDESCLQHVMTALYGRIADELGTTRCSVERNLRTAIRQVPSEAYGTILGQSGKSVTVSDFITLCVIQLRYKR